MDKLQARHHERLKTLTAGHIRLPAAFVLYAFTFLLLFSLPAAALDNIARDYTERVGLTREQITKKLNNPVSNLWRITFRNNYTLLNGDISTKNRASWITRAQIALPIPLTEKFNLVMSPSFPILSAPVPLANGNFNRKGGLGNIKLPIFLATNRQKGLVMGLGPVFDFPSSTDPDLGTGKWSVGPNAAAFYIGKKWVLGAILSQVWSFAGKSSRKDVSAATLQYAAWYIHKSGWQVGLGSPTIVADWEADDDADRWTVPVGLGIGKLLKIPRMPVQIELEASYAVVHPNTFGERWNFRLVIKRVFPALVQNPLFGR